MATDTTVPLKTDERVASVGPVARVLARPDIGAFIGAIAVFALFSYYARGIDWAGDIGNYAVWSDQAAQYGIVAVPVALLMIGGEFDLSAGVMVGSSGLLLAYLVTDGDMNIWPAMAIVLLFGLAVGFLNGYTVVRTKLPSFIVTLATFFVLQGVNAAGTLKLTGLTAIENRVLGTRLSELHTGYRAYSRRVLLEVPFLRNALDFSFDSELLMQASHFGFRIAEVPARTRYFDDASSISLGPASVYAIKTMWAAARLVAHRSGILRSRKFSP